MSVKNFTELVVGSQYKTRNGLVVTIREEDRTDNDYPFLGRIEGEGYTKWWYTRDGFFHTHRREHEHDLVEYIQADATPANQQARTNMSSVLTEAENIVNGAREGQYGKAEDSFERIARLWNAYLINKGLIAEGSSMLSGNDAVNLMILFKLAREQHSHKRDNYVDLAGYAELGNRTAEAGKQPGASS